MVIAGNAWALLVGQASLPPSLGSKYKPLRPSPSSHPGITVPAPARLHQLQRLLVDHAGGREAAVLLHLPDGEGHGLLGVQRLAVRAAARQVTKLLQEPKLKERCKTKETGRFVTRVLEVLTEGAVPAVALLMVAISAMSLQGSYDLQSVGHLT